MSLAAKLSVSFCYWRRNGKLQNRQRHSLSGKVTGITKPQRHSPTGKVAEREMPSSMFRHRMSCQTQVDSLKGDDFRIYLYEI